MPISSLDTDLRQFFSYSVLSRLDRLDDAGVNFTFEAGPLYLTCFAEAMRRIEPAEFRESDPELLRYAQVFERFASLRIPGISKRSACRTAATMYWLAGYSANATVLARSLLQREEVRARCVALSRSSSVGPPRSSLRSTHRSLREGRRIRPARRPLPRP